MDLVSQVFKGCPNHEIHIYTCLSCVTMSLNNLRSICERQDQELENLRRAITLTNSLAQRALSSALKEVNNANRSI